MEQLEVEQLDEFRSRARSWMIAHLPDNGRPDEIDDRNLQRLLFDAGFAGIAFPRSYGGAGLTLEHQKVFFDEAASLGRRTPQGLGVSIGMLGATLLDHGSETFKAAHLPAVLRGDESWIQLLSEPSGGSDLAGALTRLTADGDIYVLNGSKMWSSGALWADFGMCLARTDWDVSKHRGLSMIAVPLKDTAGVTIKPIRQVTGELGEFCVEFFDNVVLPAGNLIGLENQGWAVAQTLLAHERNTTAGIGHGYGLMDASGDRQSRGSYTRVAAGLYQRGLQNNSVLRQRVAESYIETTVGSYAGDRVMTGMRIGALQAQWGSLLKLHLGVNAPRTAKDALATWGPDGVIWDGEETIVDNVGEQFLNSRVLSIAGGTNEMQRNIVSERLMGLPREPSFDRDKPFAQVLHDRQHF